MEFPYIGLGTAHVVPGPPPGASVPLIVRHGMLLGTTPHLPPPAGQSPDHCLTFPVVKYISFPSLAGAFQTSPPTAACPCAAVK